MGWNTGGAIMGEIINALKEVGISKEERMQIYEILIPVFEDFDCDVLDEQVDSDVAFKKVYREMYPEIDFDDEEEYDEWDPQGL